MCWAVCAVLLLAAPLSTAAADGVIFAAPRSLRLSGARRSLREAGWFGPSEFSKQIDITKPEHAVHAAALEELEKTHGVKFVIDNLQHVPARTINHIHALLSEAKRAEAAKRGSVASEPAKRAAATPAPKDGTWSLGLDPSRPCCPLRGSTVNAAGDREHEWGKWACDAAGRRAVKHGNTFLMNTVMPIVNAMNRGQRSWEHPLLTFQKTGRAWSVMGVLDIFPYKIDFAPQRQAKLFPPGSAIDSFRQRCASGEFMWACALMIGPDVLADIFQRALAVWPTVWDNPPPKPKPTDAVIHFRCGDIVGGSRNQMYGVPNFAWYASHVPKDAKRVLIVGNFASKTSRNEDKNGDIRCALIAKEFPAFIKRETGIDSFIIDNGSAERDFTFLAQAKTLIGSISTFSLSAAACNRHGRSVLPASRLLCGDRKTCLSLNFERISFVPWKGLSVRGGGLGKKRKAMDIVRSLVMGEGDWAGEKSALMSGQEGVCVGDKSNAPITFTPPCVIARKWRLEDKRGLGWHPPPRGTARVGAGHSGAQLAPRPPELAPTPPKLDPATAEPVRQGRPATQSPTGEGEPHSSMSCDASPALLDVSGPAVEVPLSAADLDVPEKDVGNTARFEALVAKLHNGAPVNILVFGGSVSAGHGCTFNLDGDSGIFRPAYCEDAALRVETQEQVTFRDWRNPRKRGDKGKMCPCSWSGALELWLKRAFPRSRITVTTHATGARGIDYMLTTLPDHRAEVLTADLVIFEFSLNNRGFSFGGDGPDYSETSGEMTVSDYETLFQAMLPMPKRPALLMLEFAFVSECQEISGATHWDKKVARHYSVPVIDFHRLAFAKYKAASASETIFYEGQVNRFKNDREVQVPRRRLREVAAATEGAEPGMTPGQALKHNMQNARTTPYFLKHNPHHCSPHHPKAVIHHQLANSVAQLLVRSWKSLCARGWKLDEAALRAQLPQKPLHELKKLPVPLYMRTAKGTPAAAWGASCISGSDVVGSCSDKPGKSWNLFEDRPDKPGWIGSEAGAHVAFKVPQGGCATKMVIGYLQSYESVGKVRIFMSPCAAGHDCKGGGTNSEVIELDALEPKTRQSVYHELAVDKKAHPTWCNAAAGDTYVHFVVQELTSSELKARAHEHALNCRKHKSHCPKFKLELLAGY